MTLSIPIEKPSGKVLTRDVRISSHDNWQHLHWTAIESAYQSSPFFEYYQEDLRPFFEPQKQKKERQKGAPSGMFTSSRSELRSRAPAS